MRSTLYLKGTGFAAGIVGIRLVCAIRVAPDGSRGAIIPLSELHRDDRTRYQAMDFSGRSILRDIKVIRVERPGNSISFDPCDQMRQCV